MGKEVEGQEGGVSLYITVHINEIKNKIPVVLALKSQNNYTCACTHISHTNPNTHTHK